MLDFMKPNTARQKTGWAAAAAIGVAMCAGYRGLCRAPVCRYGRTGHPITWCYGETKADGPVPTMNATFTKEQCTDLLEKSLVKYDNGIKKYIHVVMGRKHRSSDDGRGLQSRHRYLQEGSMTRYLNVGGNFNRWAQTATYNRYHPLACQALLQYDHANGKAARLTRRRQAEAETLPQRRRTTQIVNGPLVSRMKKDVYATITIGGMKGNSRMSV